MIAIESSIAGGSLSLIRDGVEMGNWIGTQTGGPRSEELLFDIDAMLTACSVSKHDLDLIAVSAGPGSFTGIRIGIATALGLKNGLGIPMTSVSALEALFRTVREPAAVAVPMGRGWICVQEFGPDGTPLGRPRSVAEAEFASIVARDRVAMHSMLAEKYSGRPSVLDLGANIALAVGLLAAERPGTVTEPLFISKEAGR